MLLSWAAARPIWSCVTAVRERRTRWVDREPYALAYLNDGPRLGVLATVSYLVVAGRVTVEA